MSTIPVFNGTVLPNKQFFTFRVSKYKSCRMASIKIIFVKLLTLAVVVSVVIYHQLPASDDDCFYPPKRHDLLTEKLEKFTKKIEILRNRLLVNASTSHEDHSTSCLLSNVRIADARSPSYFETIRSFGIKTLYLQDSVQNISRYLTTKYYDYMSNDCALLNKILDDKKYLGYQCRKYLNETVHGHTVSEIDYSVGLPSNTNKQADGTQLLTYLHVVTDALVYEDGDVFVKNRKILPQTCKRNTTKSCPKLPRKVLKLKEVFTISQFWGNNFFHGIVENLVRIAPYLHFLQRNLHIKIHVAAGMKYVNLLGISKSRLIPDKVIHAEILYMPAGGPCGNPTLFSTQVLAKVLASVVNNTFRTKRDTIVLIKRSEKRWFQSHYSILRMLQSHAYKLNLHVEVYDDNPVPHINKTMKMFGRALVVIAPHGAGETNILFSEPGSLLIEGLCYDESHKVNMCYRNLATVLGLRYYGLVYEDQCMRITAKQIERPLLNFLREIGLYNGRER